MEGDKIPALPETLSAAVIQTADRVASEPDLAAAWAREILKFAPGQPHAVALLVSARRQSGDLAGAREILTQMAGAEPNLASIHYELGLVCHDLGDPAGAVTELERAVALEPQHPLALRALNDLLSHARREDSGKSRAEDLELLRKQVIAIDPAARPGKEHLPAIERSLRDWLALYPTDVTSRRMLGGICLRLGRREEAEREFSRAVELSPRFSVARWQLAKCLKDRNAWDAALFHVELLLKENPDDYVYLNSKADALMKLRRFEEAIGCYETLLSKHPAAENWMFYGHALNAVGRSNDCIAAYRRAIAVNPAFGQAYWSLANMKTFRFEPADLDAMQRVLKESALDRNNRSQMHFALGKALEDARDYAGAFEHYANANAIWRSGLAHHPDDMTAFVRRSKAIFTSEFYRSRAEAGSPVSGPIFIVGLPRSGTTLVEQILASHSMVEGLGELNALNSVAERLADVERTGGENYPEILEERTAEECRAGGGEYIALTRAYRRLDRPFFIDKMPGNSHHLGLLLLILPNAKVIDARRHPLATGFANFRQFYPQGQSFACDLADIGRYYRDYVELMAHFDRVLPGRIHRVFYEEMVTNTEQEIRRLLEYCGLPFEGNCLRFYQTDRGVVTASSEQVRRPIFTEGMTQWRHFEPWLGPLKLALGNVLECYPAAPTFADEAPSSTAKWSLTGNYRWLNATPQGYPDRR